MTPIRTAARTLLGALFIGSGWMALRHPDRLVPKAKPVTDRLSPALQAASLPTEAETLVKVNGALQLTGGLLLATGHLTRPAATALAVSVVPSTLAAHPFWTETDPHRRADQRVQFAKNLGLLGGLLFAAVDRGGKPSLAWRTRHAAHDARRAATALGTTAGLSSALAAKRAGYSVRRAGDALSETFGNAAWRASTAASDARRSVRRTARTARREARLAARAVQLGRRLPF
jgi:putative oxidoreductase